MHVIIDIRIPNNLSESDLVTLVGQLQTKEDRRPIFHFEVTGDGYGAAVE